MLLETEFEVDNLPTLGSRRVLGVGLPLLVIPEVVITGQLLGTVIARTKVFLFLWLKELLLCS